MWGMIGIVVAIVGAALWSVVLAVTDLRSWRLPDRLTLPAAVVALVYATAFGDIRALCGAFAWWALCALPGVASPRLRIGGGDAKLSVSLGAVVAALGGIVGWCIAVSCASVVTLLLAGFPRFRGRRGVPHGPGMLVGSWTVALLTI